MPAPILDRKSISLAVVGQIHLTAMQLHLI